jgi:hypothetical protein
MCSALLSGITTFVKGPPEGYVYRTQFNEGVEWCEAISTSPSIAIEAGEPMRIIGHYNKDDIQRDVSMTNIYRDQMKLAAEVQLDRAIEAAQRGVVGYRYPGRHLRPHPRTTEHPATRRPALHAAGVDVHELDRRRLLGLVGSLDRQRRS